jgi:hypothetical protein
LAELTPARLAKIESARARVRRHVWSLLAGGLPPSRVADTDLGEVVVLDVDATLVVAQIEKEAALTELPGHRPCRRASIRPRRATLRGHDRW